MTIHKHKLLNLIKKVKLIISKYYKLNILNYRSNNNEQKSTFFTPENKIMSSPTGGGAVKFDDNVSVKSINNNQNASIKFDEDTSMKSSPKNVKNTGSPTNGKMSISGSPNAKMSVSGSPTNAKASIKVDVASENISKATNDSPASPVRRRPPSKFGR